MDYVRAKKNLGQHFLKDQNIARKIVESLPTREGSPGILEVGPGMGVLTRYLAERPGADLKVIEIDRESVAYLRQHFPGLGDSLVEGDFLKLPLRDLFPGPFSVIGNFPYHISSQIFFRVLEHRDLIHGVVGMVQKEVAERISAPPGSKTYGILSVLLQAWYRIEYLFTVGEQVFAPPPKVKSAVIRLRRNDREALDCDESLFFEVVKCAFNQRRKMLGNALKPLGKPVPEAYAGKRAEQLSPLDFESLTRLIGQWKGGDQ
ncbi:MAG: 16S rRNA (adenine(1518)-N(6)/adenine(1519)-N(6))-dimethyltransferase RsmA [Prolixibacteraceae bacterium]|jgi:16S rRNA (adenine1518-N6/adenine1519-N6)-dimethyltransferase|nr:16S rRNA (adenine(1518)-N(6)/adenine(1519)-N(6))-dimethyltransferase RsmA [Prolixibacteraceae bacterium]HNQ38203.1 16S rRNA (adenine(1518)-N(6)/adenine(1519)-N(6))-dimethyltransferase RsmA [Prolixibacteraceae bacterium]HPJ78454.1 16S rRNA (adenine(1518)-N(6)/adenine(1519)-N(6))-dimethyltransferase RsmA [Prolixibacteraceae bacterium]HRV89620.1 16S rRNA (adenine(1518)-N(6)/adenine(1519)-N(6))-dimethyltransferase RsmA [Prolixibacteraceae bacterium]